MYRIARCHHWEDQKNWTGHECRSVCRRVRLYPEQSKATASADRIVSCVAVTGTVELHQLCRYCSLRAATQRAFWWHTVKRILKTTYNFTLKLAAGSLYVVNRMPYRTEYKLYVVNKMPYRTEHKLRYEPNVSLCINSAWLYSIASYQCDTALMHLHYTINVARSLTVIAIQSKY